MSTIEAPMGYEHDSNQLCRQLYQEREMRKQYEGILRRIVEAHNGAIKEAEKPLHQRTRTPLYKRNGAIKDARQVLGGQND